jgi:hypothetical protein
VAYIKAVVGTIIGLKHSGSSRDTRSKSEQGPVRQGYRARQRFFAGSLCLCCFSLVRAVGEQGGGGEVGLRTGVLLAADVQRADSMLLSSNQSFHSGPHPCWCAAGGFQSVLWQLSHNGCGPRDCVRNALHQPCSSSRPSRPVTHEIHCVDALATSKQRLTGSVLNRHEPLHTCAISRSGYCVVTSSHL